jgi:hypothetical protein
MNSLLKQSWSVADRAEHAAVIANAGNAWAEYQALHQETFMANKLTKFVVVNADGKELGKFGKSEDAQKLVVNANGTLRHEDFMIIRDRIVEVRRRSLHGIQDLMDMGLRFDVSIMDQLVGFEKINEFQEAEQQMNPNAYQNNDTNFTEDFVPNPITHHSFQVPWRQQGFDYKRSLGLSESTRQVSEKLENTLFNGNTSIVVSFNGSNFPIYGYTTHPDRGTGTISDWTIQANVDKIVDEVVDQVSAMFSGQGGIGNNSVMLYLDNDFWNVFQKDYKAEVKGTVMERVKKIAQIKDVKPAEKLASKTAVLVEMESRTVELAVATDIVAVPHTKTNPMAPQPVTTYAAMVHQIKSDTNGNTGIRHLTI